MCMFFHVSVVVSDAQAAVAMALQFKIDQDFISLISPIVILAPTLALLLTYPTLIGKQTRGSTLMWALWGGAIFLTVEQAYVSLSHVCAHFRRSYLNSLRLSLPYARTSSQRSHPTVSFCFLQNH